MEKRLVTVATHSYERAQLLKTLLEDYNIPVFLENINLLEGTYIKGARVRVSEENLEQALKIVEEAYQRMNMDKPKNKQGTVKVLIPIDFTQNCEKICQLGFNIAEKTKGEVTFMHAYYNPVMGGIPFSDSFSYSMEVSASIKWSAELAQKQMHVLLDKIKTQIKDKSLPQIKVKSVILTGIPEDEIVEYAASYQPSVIVMGTRRVDKKHDDMIGSVTAEVIDRVKVPVFAIPENINISIGKSLELMYITNFEERNFNSFDKLIRLLSPFDMHYHLVHFTEANNVQDKVRMESMENIFKERYGANKNVDTSIIETENFLFAIETYIQKHKIDVISLTTHRRNIFARMFNPGIAHKMIFHSNTPLLVFHS